LDTENAAVNVTFCGYNFSANPARRFLQESLENIIIEFDVTILEETNFPDLTVFEQVVARARELLSQSILTKSLVKLFTDLLQSIRYFSPEEASVVSIDSDSFVISNSNVQLLFSKAPTSQPTFAPTESPSFSTESRIYTDQNFIIFLSIFLPAVVCVLCGFFLWFHFSAEKEEEKQNFVDVYEAGADSPGDIEASGHTNGTSGSDQEPLNLMELAVHEDFSQDTFEDLFTGTTPPEDREKILESIESVAAEDIVIYYDDQDRNDSFQEL